MPSATPNRPAKAKPPTVRRTANWEHHAQTKDGCAMQCNAWCRESRTVSVDQQLLLSMNRNRPPGIMGQRLRCLLTHLQRLSGSRDSTKSGCHQVWLQCPYSTPSVPPVPLTHCPHPRPLVHQFHNMCTCGPHTLPISRCAVQTLTFKGVLALGPLSGQACTAVSGHPIDVLAGPGERGGGGQSRRAGRPAKGGSTLETPRRWLNGIVCHQPDEGARKSCRLDYVGPKAQAFSWVPSASDVLASNQWSWSVEPPHPDPTPQNGGLCSPLTPSPPPPTPATLPLKIRCAPGQPPSPLAIRCP